ncbi:plasmid mobilization protein [Staphylococcus warneri]|uniref:plasmid mobilization protein n=1 Tax=Staphylococcus warneri TaxID=1292 RepID=UPI003D04FE69
MPKKQSSKEKILTVRVSQAQYKKIQDLAYIRSMNVTEYIRQTAVGNRIKPTVIEYPKEQTTLEDYEEDSKVSELESKINEYEELIQAQVDTLKRMLTHIDSTGYINFGSYKNDRLLLNQIRNSKRD